MDGLQAASRSAAWKRRHVSDASLDCGASGCAYSDAFVGAASHSAFRASKAATIIPLANSVMAAAESG